MKMFTACNHIVDDNLFESRLCPKCYGKGFYFDINFESGKPVLSEGSDKLMQEILKILIEDKGDNIFHPEWGNEVNTRLIGTKNIEVKRTKLEVMLRNTLDYLRTVQQAEDEEWENMTNEELLGEIELIKVTPVGPTGYNIKIQVVNTAGKTVSQTFNI